MHVHRGVRKNVFKGGNYFPTARTDFILRGIGVATDALSRFRGRTGAVEEALRVQRSSDVEVVETGLYERARRSIVRLVELLVEEASVARASDIHIDPRAHALFVRLRIDGYLQEGYELPLSIHAELLSRIKILADLRTDEHYAAQDGRFRLALSNGPPVDVRVSIAPSYYGENAVMRLLSGSSQTASLAGLAFSEEHQSKIIRVLQRPHGMILATGPTGSGKTTTMYTLMQLANAPGISAITLEDPVEYAMPGVNQIQINPKTGLTFAAGLRSILRQDPDIVMVGEIRDAESASLAIHAALTGHRLLSTLHTTDAAGTITRLSDMGVEPYLIASTVALSIGQRLVRRICDYCRVGYPISKAEFRRASELLPVSALSAETCLFRGSGCEKCRGTGYCGRAGVHEVLEVTPALREAIQSHATTGELRIVAIAEGMKTIASDAIAKAVLGITTFEEALKTAYE